MEKKKEVKKKPVVHSVMFCGMHNVHELNDLIGKQGAFTHNPLQYRFDDKVVDLGDTVVSTDGVITIRRKKK